MHLDHADDSGRQIVSFCGLLALGIVDVLQVLELTVVFLKGLLNDVVGLAVEKVVGLFKVGDHLFPALLWCRVLKRANDAICWLKLQHAVTKLRGEKIIAEATIEISLCKTSIAYSFIFHCFGTCDDLVARCDAIV